MLYLVHSTRRPLTKLLVGEALGETDVNSYFDGMRRYADFRGRSTRSQFWWFTLVVLVLAIVGLGIDGTIDSGPADGLGIVSTLVMLAHLIPGLAVSVRRLRDIDKSGWWVLIQQVPLVGLVVGLIFYCTASTPGTNRFGPHPKGGTTAPSPVAAPAAGNGAHLDQLEKLAALRSSGAIDETEFQRMKSDVLSRAVS
jgi:uncharacterized membrane protein YhaH (DUF805 family)